MITHYGLFWSERDVFWGHQKKKGELLGHEKTPLERRGAPTRNEGVSRKDYRTFVGLYCLYGDGALLYVGEAGLASKQSLFSRLNAHRKGSMAGRWDKFSWFGREPFGDTEETKETKEANIKTALAQLEATEETKETKEANIKTALAQLEAIVIAIINPGFNKQSGTFDSAIQVFQVPHEDSEGSLETKVELIYDMVEKLSKDRDTKK